MDLPLALLCTYKNQIKMQTVKALQVEQISYKDLLQSFETIVKETVKQTILQTPAQSTPPEYMTREEVAKLFSVTLPTIHAWANAGILTPYKIGAKTRFKRSEVLESPKALKENLKKD